MSIDTKERLDNHELRIEKLEEKDLEKEIRLRKVEDSYLRLENTIMSENRETRDILRESMTKQWELIKSRDEVKDAQKARDHEYRKTKLERKTELTIKLLTVGGLGYLLIQSVFNFMM